MTYLILGDNEQAQRAMLNELLRMLGHEVPGVRVALVEIKQGAPLDSVVAAFKSGLFDKLNQHFDEVKELHKNSARALENEKRQSQAELYSQGQKFNTWHELIINENARLREENAKAAREISAMREEQTAPINDMLDEIDDLKVQMTNLLIAINEQKEYIAQQNNIIATQQKRLKALTGET